MSPLRKPLAALALLLAAAVLAQVCFRNRSPAPHSDPRPPGSSRRDIGPDLTAEVARIEAREERLALTVWQKEMLAQACGRTVERLWDSVNAASNKLGVVSAFSAGEMLLGKWTSEQALPHGIKQRQSGGPGPVLSAAEWRTFVADYQRAGWQIETVEFRHNRFETDAAGRPWRSTFYFSAHAFNAQSAERAALEGDLAVRWSASRPENEPFTIEHVDASGLTLKTRAGNPPFELLLREPMDPPENSNLIDPLILHDLDGDGLSEIILAARNVFFRRHGQGQFESEPLCPQPPGLIFTALIADFDRDGAADFLAQRFEGFVLYPGSNRGRFDRPERVVWSAHRDVKYPMALACGDVDADGDLDLFLGQYKVPYEDGAMPTPYHDANDGPPAYLLINDGTGNFSDGTERAGLTEKRWRRTYSASLADLDGDVDLDLIVISDFAGVDLYRNDGRGRFDDVTSEWIAEPHAFGMAHVSADFNTDGELDFLMIGMTSPTVDRLEFLNLWRPNLPEDRSMRSRMTFGNRLYLSRSGRGFEQTPLSDSIARSGWSWGCAAFDFDNDTFPDVYVGNGLESRDSVREYEPEYWLHDAYVGNSRENPAVYHYFKNKFARTRGQGHSYGGYDKNRFFLNRGGRSFLETAYLFGVGLEDDCRNVVADDLDGDGRMDLIVTGFEPWPQARQSLRVYRNTAAAIGHWIGLRFREEQNGSAIGARVLLRAGSQKAVRAVVAGDSYRSQSANSIHFGLGQTDHVDAVEIRWPDGRKVLLQEPAVDRYHTIQSD